MSWSSVARLFAAALETPPDERQPVLDSCPDAEVRAEVHRLLALHDDLVRRDDDFPGTLDLGCAASLVDAIDQNDPAAIGRYEVVRRLGAGATGAVYLARDPELDRQVAVKLLSPELSRDATGVRRFTDEARAASRLDSPHIVAIHEIGRSESGRLFIAMAYHEGETLRQRIARETVPVEEALRIAGDVAEGLAAAHTRGIVHRDIKPENILLTARGACIVDFGIAKVVGETLTRTGTALGTAAYMSPEQTRGTGVDQRSDLWSLGVVLYEMLTGERPFSADGSEALIYRIRHDPAEPVTARRPTVPPSVSRIVDRCLQKEPDRRYQSAAELASVLSAPLPAAGKGPVRVVGAAAAVVTAMVTAGLLAAPKGDSTALPPPQLSTILPLHQQPGAIAVLSPTEDSSRVSADGKPYLEAPNVAPFRGELIRVLSATPGIRVTYPGSVRILYEAGADLKVMGDRLGVMAVLEWNLRRRDSLVTVDARLVRVSDARDLWSHVYERPVGEAGAIVEQIRRSVTRALGLDQGDSPSLRRGATTDVVAYDYYLRALDADGKDQRDEAVHLLGRAIARDSGFALAYARLADLYMSAWAGAPADRWGQVRPLVEKALELDSTLALAHRTAGWIAMWQDRDWDTAERHLSRSLALDSSDVWTYYRYAACLAATGRTVESLSIARRATRIDPISSTSATEVGLHLYWNRRYDEAIAVLERAKVVDNYWWQKMPMVLGRAYLATGRYQDAIREFRRAGVQTSEGFEAPALLAHALGRAGRIQEANVLITQYWDRARAASARPVDLAVAYLGMADTARALDWVERIPGDTGSRFYLLNEPIFDSVRGTPRFRRVLEALGLGAAATRADSIREAGTAFPRPLEAADQKALRHS